MTVTIHFAGSSDDLLHLEVTTTGNSHAHIDDTGTQSHQLDEISAHAFRGWLITPADAPAFAVYALLGPMGPTWCFAVGFPPGTDEDDGADIGMIHATVRQSPATPYSTELTVQIGGSCSIEAIPGRVEGA